MALSDKKRAQTIRNLWYRKVAEPVLNANTVVAAIRGAIVGAGLTGEFTQAERDAMLAVEADLAALASLAGITLAEGKYRPNHSTEQGTVGLDI